MSPGKLILALLFAIPGAFILVALIGMGIEMASQPKDLPFGCTVEQTTPSGECF